MSRGSLPDSVRRRAETALEEAGWSDPGVRSARPVPGGCINDAVVLDTGAGERAFLKWNQSAPPGFFGAEADGLRALTRCGALRVPGVISVGGETGPAFLLLEYVPPGRPGPDFGRTLGRGVARVHGCLGESFGWSSDNYVGSIPQANGESPDWAAFWRDLRLGPLARSGAERGLLASGEAAEIDRLLGRTESLLEGCGAAPSLLHGDLWSGNVYAADDGRPVLVDPAVYRGHGEVDLAMAELFGGFPADFLQAYREELPLEPGYEEVRRDLYQVYPLLVHLHLFGRGYAGGLMERVRRLG